MAAQREHLHGGYTREYIALNFCCRDRNMEVRQTLKYAFQQNINFSICKFRKLHRHSPLKQRY